ncbi:hypothetical protein EON82_07185 [bacterium]|nr:MAG: hypothetical protein EON82_07185 [bacterium]
MKPRVSYYTIHGVIVPIYTITAVGYIFTHPDLQRLPRWITFLHFWCVLVAIGYYFAREIRCRRRTERDLAHMERPEGVDEYPVEITVTNNAVVGCDRGVIYFDGPHLGFVGGRSSFLIAFNDLELPAENLLTTAELPYRPLKVKASGGSATPTVRPLLGYQRAYRKRLTAFLKAEVPSEDERQWPPLTAYVEPKRTMEAAA